MILSERLLLRELSIADAPFILELLNDSDFPRYIGDRGVRTLADAEHYIQQGPAVSYARHGHGLYLVARRGDEAKIGICGLIRRDTLPCEDIGYAFLPAYRGQGYGIEAAKAALQDGHGEPDRVGDPGAQRTGGALHARGVADLGVTRGERTLGAQGRDVGEIRRVLISVLAFMEDSGGGTPGE